MAIDSVLWDLSNAEHAKLVEGQRYLERATAVGLGTHKHWTNFTDKQYTNIDFRKIDMASISRLDIDQKIRDFNAGNASEQEVKDMIDEYMDTN